eukprot:364604-Chlamydomonas_euryale.AAC.7
MHTSLLRFPRQTHPGVRRRGDDEVVRRNAVGGVRHGDEAAVDAMVHDQVIRHALLASKLKLHRRYGASGHQEHEQQQGQGQRRLPHRGRTAAGPRPPGHAGARGQGAEVRGHRGVGDRLAVSLSVYHAFACPTLNAELRALLRVRLAAAGSEVRSGAPSRGARGLRPAHGLCVRHGAARAGKI